MTHADDTRRVAEARKAFRDVRKYGALAMALLDGGGVIRAYAAAQAAYEAAHDARAIIAGDLARYDAASNEPQYPPEG